MLLRERALDWISRIIFKRVWVARVPLLPKSLLFRSHQIWYITATQVRRQKRLRSDLPLKVLQHQSKVVFQLVGTLGSPQRAIARNQTSFEKVQSKNKCWCDSFCCLQRRQERSEIGIPHLESLSRVGNFPRIAIHAMRECFGIEFENHRIRCHCTFGEYCLIRFQIILRLKEEICWSCRERANGWSLSNFFKDQLSVWEILDD